METLKQENGKVYKTTVTEIDPKNQREGILGKIAMFERAIAASQEGLDKANAELAEIEGVYDFKATTNETLTSI